jgi:hypothetical protein
MNPVLQQLDELCDLEAIRQTRILSKFERARWSELQKTLTRALCDASTAAAIERRNTLRLNCPLEVRVESAGAIFVGTAIDVSAGGIGVRASLLPAAGERVTLLSAEDPPGAHFELAIPGRVVWLRKLQHELGAGFGIAFDPQGEPDERKLAELLLYLLRKERKSRTP